MVQFESEEDVEETLYRVESDMRELLGCHHPQFKRWATEALSYVGKVRDAIKRDSWPEAVFYALWLSVPKGIVEQEFGIMDAESKRRAKAREAGRKKRRSYSVPDQELLEWAQKISHMTPRSIDRRVETKRLAGKLSITLREASRLVTKLARKRRADPGNPQRRFPAGDRPKGDAAAEEAWDIAFLFGDPPPSPK